MSPVSATPDRSSMNGSVEYRALNVGFIPTNVADRMPQLGRSPTVNPYYRGGALDLQLSTGTLYRTVRI